MAKTKDVNIHIQTPGADKARRDLDAVSDSTKRVGDDVAKTGRDGQRSTDGLFGSVRKLAGNLGFAGLAVAVAASGRKVMAFFDELKGRVDEAVKNVESLRSSYEGLFEAFGAFDEAQRRSVVASSTATLHKTGVEERLGLSVIEEYKRVFGSRISGGEYDRGLEGMLSYAARHGGSQTTDLIQMMGGWGADTESSQGSIRRMIAAAAEASGLRDSDVIGALSRGMPTIKAMGWTPERAIQSIAILASGESGRQKMSLPAATISALGAPQTGGLGGFGIDESLAENPASLFAAVQKMAASMPRQQAYRMLTQIYGSGAAPGVSKLMSTPADSIQTTLRRAAGPAGTEQELQEELARRTTMEFMAAQSAAAATAHSLDLTDTEVTQTNIRRIGAAHQARLRRRQPVRQWLRERFNPQQSQLEDAAYRFWIESLAPDQARQISQEFPVGMSGADPYRIKWHTMTPQQQLGAVSNVTNINNHYDHSTNYYPRTGPDASGPRYTQD